MKGQLADRSTRVVGKKQVVRALVRNEVAEVFLAKDGDPFIQRDIRELATKAQAPVTEVESMAQLGRACGIEVKASVAARLKERVS
ncbi:MAG TPA: ribosomal L7Ae/L30e/S12e/Gadd45 family protein [Bacillota bacterium]|nr:ribosomal L7Ae/L30e/S12e/Gadd45 family protein [Bacillota bacterium]HOA15652.1 ribosomal L7Ae/L30e/S12e/Gadd45 family protein [Bacillota bacterium]HOG53744.1 ribosomal L7Ae/L30e/S12e/Gadd45 family protein [Bacillota bacterium]